MSRVVKISYNLIAPDLLVIYQDHLAPFNSDCATNAVNQARTCASSIDGADCNSTDVCRARGHDTRLIGHAAFRNVINSD